MSTRSVETDFLTDSLGRYVLAIYELSVENRVARSKDIAETVGVSRPSVTGALQKLVKAGLIEYEPYGYVVLTADGMNEARQLLLRHRAMFDFLETVLGLSEARAIQVAGEIEQHLPGDVLCRLIQFNKYYRDNPAANYSWDPRCNNLCKMLYGVNGRDRCEQEIEPTPLQSSDQTDRP